MEKKSLSMREKIMLAVVAVIGLIVVFYMFVFKPQREDISLLQSKVTQKEQEVKKYINFDDTIAATNAEVDELDKKIRDATSKWYPRIKQENIIKDLEPDMKNTNLNNSTISFVNSQVAQIASLSQSGETPTLAEALTLAYLTMLESAQNETAASPKPAVSPTPAPTATPSGSNDKNATTLSSEPKKKDNTQEKVIDPSVQQKFDALNASLKNLSDKDLQMKINEIVLNNTANVQKLTVSIYFQDSTYQSIMDFMHNIEAASPSIYITDLTYADSTEEYVKKLEDEAKAAANQAVQAQQTTVADLLQTNQSYSTQKISQVQEAPIISYNGPSRYSGSFTLTYFAIAKIHGDDQQNQ
ncbi:MAG: type II secretion system protein M [Clostridia bacterium]|nr:type II secretion system protein M [Clostridia bacterium]